MRIGGILLLVALLFGCGTKKHTAMDNSQTSLDWSGVYLFSNEDYKKPEMQLTLNENGTYKLIVAAFGDNERNTYLEGKFEWDKQGKAISLDKQVPQLLSNRLVVGENKLFVLKGDNQQPLNELSSFQKIQVDTNLTEKYWKLISINEREVTKDDFMSKEPHLKFKSEFNRVEGNDGCNGFGGVYSLDGDTIKFDKMMSTLMACPDSFVYEQFMKILRDELTYTADEETLMIQSKEAVMKFKVVYF